ncbi:MAG: type II secretion system protein [Nitrospirae bacterium]|nr:type II secretion system protein [Nitrospirota bacterium]
MLPTHCNNRGLTLLEVIVALVILMIGIIGTLAVFPQGSKLTLQSDRIGRAAALMHQNLEQAQLAIMNCCCATPTNSTTNVYSSGSTWQSGDLPFTVQRTVAAVGSMWRVTVKVTWPGNTTGYSESIVVSNQEFFKSGCSTCPGAIACIP